MFCLHVGLWTMYLLGVHRNQKRVSDSLEQGVTDGYKPPHWCWELNPNPREDQPVILTKEQSLQFLNYLNFKTNREMECMFPVEIIWGINKHFVKNGIGKSQVWNGQNVDHREGKHGGESRVGR